MAVRSWMGWSALAAVLAVYAVSQSPNAAPWIQDAKSRIAAVLPPAMAQKLAVTAPAVGGSAVAKPQATPSTAPAGSPQAKRAGPPAPVLTDKVKTANVPLRLEGVGSVQARTTVAVKARIDGQLMEAAIKEGQPVKKGDLLFKLDARPLEAALKVAEANLARDKANLEKAKSDLARISDLAVKGYSPKAKYDEAKAGFGALEATV